MSVSLEQALARLDRLVEPTDDAVRDQYRDAVTPRTVFDRPDRRLDCLGCRILDGGVRSSHVRLVSSVGVPTDRDGGTEYTEQEECSTRAAVVFR